MRPASRDDGETLIELLIAVAIMGIAVVAIVGGIATSILMSDIHRKEATAGASARNYAEAVATYVAIPGNFNATISAISLQTAVGFTEAGFTPTVTLVKCWSETSNAFGDCAASSTVQQVTLNVASADLGAGQRRASESLVVVVRKPS